MKRDSSEYTGTLSIPNSKTLNTLGNNHKKHSFIDKIMED